MNFILVDSSVWIRCFSKKPNPLQIELIHAAKKEKLLAICDMVFLEVTRGARSDQEYKELCDEFMSLKQLPTQEEHWNYAGKMGFTLARKGIHPPSTDLIIAAVAILEKAKLLHQDKDFINIAKYFPLDFVEC